MPLLPCQISSDAEEGQPAVLDVSSRPDFSSCDSSRSRSASPPPPPPPSPPPSCTPFSARAPVLAPATLEMEAVMSQRRAADLEALRHRAKNMGVTNSEWYAIAQQSFQQICAFVVAIERIESNIPGASKSSSSAASSGSCSGSSTVSASPLSSASTCASVHVASECSEPLGATPDIMPPWVHESSLWSDFVSTSSEKVNSFCDLSSASTTFFSYL